MRLMNEIIIDVNDWRPNLPSNPHSSRSSGCCFSNSSNSNPKPSQSSKSKKKKKMKVYNPPYTEQYFDTHCHLDWLLTKKFNGCDVADFHQIVEHHFNGHFGGALTVACWPEQYKVVEQLIYHHHASSDHIYGSFGIHPRIAHQWNDGAKQRIIDLVAADRARGTNKIVAVGECGLDYSNMEVNADKSVQEQAFREQIELSVVLDLPLVVHSRMAEEDTYRVMKECCPKEKLVHLHCLTDSLKFARKMLEYFPNLKIGFTGTVLFKNNVDLRETVKNVPIDRIMLETDAPFFGSAVHPGYIPKIAEKVAECHGISDVNMVIKQCRENARAIYGV